MRAAERETSSMSLPSRMSSSLTFSDRRMVTPSSMSTFLTWSCTPASPVSTHQHPPRSDLLRRSTQEKGKRKQRWVPSSRRGSSWSRWRCCCWWWRRWWGSERRRTSSCSGTPWWHPWWGSGRGRWRCGWRPWCGGCRTTRPPWACARPPAAGSRGWGAWSCGSASRGAPPPSPASRPPSPSRPPGCPSSPMPGSSSCCPVLLLLRLLFLLLGRAGGGRRRGGGFACVREGTAARRGRAFYIRRRWRVGFCGLIVRSPPSDRWLRVCLFVFQPRDQVGHYCYWAIRSFPCLRAKESGGPTGPFVWAVRPYGLPSG